MSEQGTAPAAPAAAPTAPNGAKPADAKAATAPTADNGQAPAAAAPEVHEIKLSGKSQKVTADQVRTALGLAASDPVGPRELRALQIEINARNRTAASARQQKEYEEKSARLREDPISVLAAEHFGGDVVKAEQALVRYLGGRLQERALPQEERDRLDRERELEAAAKERDEMKAAQAEEAEAAKVEQIRERATSLFVDALKAAKLPVTAYTVGRMAGVVRSMSKEERAASSGADIAEIVRAELREERLARLREMAPEELAEELGDDGVKKWRTWDAERLKSKMATKAAAPMPERKPKAPAEPMSTAKAMKELKAGRNPWGAK